MEASLTVLDGVVIVFVALSALIAMARGFTREVFAILSLFLAIFIAMTLGNGFASLLNGIVDLKPLADAVHQPVEKVNLYTSSAILFLICWVIFTVISVQISDKVNNSAVGSIDRLLGFIYGIFRGVLVLSFAYFTYTQLSSTEEEQPNFVKNAKLLGVLQWGSDIITSIIPDEYKAHFPSNTKQPRIDNDTHSQRDIEKVIKEIANDKKPKDENNKPVEKIIEDSTKKSKNDEIDTDAPAKIINNIEIKTLETPKKQSTEPKQNSEGNEELNSIIQLNQGG